MPHDADDRAAGKAQDSSSNTVALPQKWLELSQMMMSFRKYPARHGPAGATQAQAWQWCAGSPLRISEHSCNRMHQHAPVTACPRAELDPSTHVSRGIHAFAWAASKVGGLRLILTIES